MYKLQIFPKASKQLKKISKIHKKAIIGALQDIQEDPLLGNPLTRELTGRFTYRVGVYRIIYKINTTDKIIEILLAGHRSTTYN